MSSPALQHHITGNLILDSLPRDAVDRLVPHLESCSGTRGHEVFPAGGEISHIYFPLKETLCSLLVHNSRERLEMAVIGREGLVGMSALMGSHRANFRTVIQSPGEMLRIRPSVLLTEFDNNKGVRDTIMHHLGWFLQLVTQNCLCNSFHSVEKRLARWLLTHNDRLGSPEFALTQQFVSDMLGVNRATVSLTAGELQRKGLIRYRRGRVSILNRQALESASCECYAISRAQRSGPGA